ncbi:MAG: alpha-ketoglutarate-dependent dioxygenase AlkB [Bacteroidetes bacterium 24-39-8]|jgi:alkylated DNA repair dioxygenase AlkB|nr:MAG: alpha-ketoglutarate-dependent dioxygenase AlkB [Sphingobacteriia bacterium 35-40-8]OYZ51970.1 MAG: alpha-ketoglutarate-dependent dioxygenase AlkB [Bacteroidetes bacterium 24-39-8]OZA66535.1 MAG: alpha-ketoglutarate-dependent dioxygenase AlkB [Sphingobacteriia bacterium 39-39-8]HQR91860.1 alpha-ketoglutarate-dependent dioxygenase AlkB [Sediminibacterium sp.]HQS55087.1 alpha-ketoglutarate-dependent dioxygenase AlkB [Sediminibacterium sp.]
MQNSLFPRPANLLPFQGDLLYEAAFLTRGDADNSLQQLQSEIPWKQEPIILFGKKIMQPRLTAWLGDKPYTYSGITMQPHAFGPIMMAIKNKVEAFTQSKFNTALLNLYRNGTDSMGWHRDNEKELGPAPIIASISLGAVREFQLRHYQTKEHLQKIPLQHGSLLIMRGQTNTYWEHRIPKTSRPLSPRINITFRQIQ